MRIFKWFVGLICSLVIIVGGGGYLYLKSKLPSYDGLVSAPVKAAVKIYRDQYGVPYILAENERDGFMALGFAMAQDRLFQMEMMRRAARGQLAEVLGPDLVEVDKLFLTLTAVKGLDEYWQEIDPVHRRPFEAFADGVNLFLAQGKLPLEFTVLDIMPRPWQPADCLAVAVIMAWDLNEAWQIDLTAAAVADRLGLDAVPEFFPDYPGEWPTIAPKGGYLGRGGLKFLKTALAARDFLGLGNASGSNSWALSGEKTTTGKPILCNDMHLGFSQPPIWWECGLIAGDYKVKGVLIPGVPLAMAGHTPKLAWALTNVMADDADFFIEKVNPDNPDQYRAGDKWLPFKKVVKVIKVKGGEPVRQVFRLTRNGVIINDLKTPAPLKGDLLAMRWSGQDVLGGAAKTFHDIVKASDWASFNRAVAQFGCPGQNFLYADVESNIGWRAGVKIPKRRGGYNPILPAEGYSGKNGWDGYLPFDQQPFVFNPPQGYLVTANNKSVGPEYPHYISHYWASPERYSRIDDMIRAKDKLSLADMRLIQTDIRSVTAEMLVPYILKAYEGQKPSEAEAEALKLLSEWNMDLDADSAAAAIHELTYVNLFKETAGDELGDLLDVWLRSHYIASRAMTRWLKNDSAVFDDKTTPQKEDRAAILRRSLKAALARLEEAFETDDMTKWRWGEIHTVTFKHPFHGQNKYLDKLIDLGPYPIGGGMFTVNPLQYRLKGDLAARSGASMRHVIDLGDLEKSRGAITTGQSGHFISPHYGDQVELWLKGTPHPLSLDPERIKGMAKYELTLEPAS